MRAGEVGRGSWGGPGSFRGRNWALEEVRVGAHAVKLTESGEERQNGRQGRGRAEAGQDPNGTPESLKVSRAGFGL